MGKVLGLNSSRRKLTLDIQIEPGKTKIGIVGAGTMGSGIALAALYAGFEVTLQDPYEAALGKAREYIEGFLRKKGLEDYLGKLKLTEKMEDFEGAGVVVEAALEDLELKREIFGKLEAICAPTAILATNTSTLSVTAIAAVTQKPERVAGMHFFNPAVVLPLVEVVRGSRTSEAAVEALATLAEKLGKMPVVVADRPGFIVNRVARPFYGEALRLLGERVASHGEIDRIVELGGGFRMGPFRLMDLIGIDINLRAMESMYEQTYGEPRYRPHWLQVQKVQEGALGRKSGRGFYVYGEGGTEKSDFQSPESFVPSGQLGSRGGGGKVLLMEGSWGEGLTELCKDAGYELVGEMEDGIVAAVVIAGREEGMEERVREADTKLDAKVPVMVQAGDVTVSEMATWMAHPERLVGFDGLFLVGGGVATVMMSEMLDQGVKTKAAAFFESLGRPPAWVKDSPGLVLPRIVCMLVNEAAFAVMEGVAQAETIDIAMRLGVNYPQGPLEWGEKLGFEKVVRVLDYLRAEFGEERYRVAGALRAWARLKSG